MYYVHSVSVHVKMYKNLQSCNTYGMLCDAPAAAATLIVLHLTLQSIMRYKKDNNTLAPASKQQNHLHYRSLQQTIIMWLKMRVEWRMQF